MGIRSNKDQFVGGTIVLPDGYFVYEVNFDAEEPYCVLYNKDTTLDEKPIKIAIPKSLAYYVTTHFCGSKYMKEAIRRDAIHECKNKIKDALQWDEK